MASTNPARGMRDFLPADVRKREYVIGIIKEVYESYGFEPLETPAVENIETLMGKYGDEGNQLVFKILKRGEKLGESLESGESRELADLALRYDLTVPLARVVANHKNDLPKFFKRYQIQPVWRADRPARGRFREFYQCDVDCIGSESMVVEAELISAIDAVFEKLGFQHYVIKLNHRGLLFAILEWANIPVENQDAALIAIDKLDKLSTDEVSKEMVGRGISQESADKVVDLYQQVATVWNQGIDVSAVLLSQVLPGSLELREHLAEIVRSSNSKHVAVYPFLARGLSYYTGAILEVVLLETDDHQHFTGSLGGGGRYDGLIGMFGKEQIPACGFSLGLERILVVMEERGMFPPEIADSTPADVMVTIWNEETIPDSLKLANELRSVGLRVTLYPEADKLGKQFKYADSIKVPFVCVIGDDEIKNGSVKLKNMASGEEWNLKSAEIVSKIKS